MNGWIDGGERMGGLMDGFWVGLGGWVWVDGRMDRWGGLMVGWVRWIDGWMGGVGWIDRWMDGWGRLMGGGLIDGWMGALIVGSRWIG